MTRRNIGSGGPWEAPVGYSRAVRVGQLVYVAGTTAAQPDGTIGGGDDPYLQALHALRTVQTALEQSGAQLRHVVRTRMFVTHIDEWESIGRAHGEFFGEIRPAATMVQVSRLIDPRLRVEIEADAVIGEEAE